MSYFYKRSSNKVSNQAHSAKKRASGHGDRRVQRGPAAPKSSSSAKGQDQEKEEIQDEEPEADSDHDVEVESDGEGNLEEEAEKRAKGEKKPAIET